MKISQGLSLLPNAGGERQKIDRTLRETGQSFGDTLTQAMSDVNALQEQAGTAVNRLVSGEATDLHEVMIAVEKARTSFDLLMEIRNKAIDAYREIMRMQV